MHLQNTLENNGPTQDALPETTDDNTTHDADLKMERIRMNLRTWKITIRHDSFRLWGTQEMHEVLTNFGNDVNEFREAWIAHTVDWVQSHLQHGAKDNRLQNRYQKYLLKYRQIAMAMQLKKRDLDAEK